jgi:asparagine synthase (glutamine-hydrolysing)
MRADGFKVTYSGEGSDELWASYGFAYHALKTRGWNEYRKELYKGQHRKNFARCNKIFMAYSVECRLPFLCRELAELALSLPREVVERGGKMKAVMSEAFRGLLPDEVVDRPKLAFQDGMGIKKKMGTVVPDPARFYRAEFKRAFRGVSC